MEIEARLLAAFVTGVLSSGHCFGMCGGIAGALALQGRVAPGARGPSVRLVAHNLGRIGTYALLGALAGLAAGAIGGRLPVAWAQRSSKLFAALCFAGLALYLLGRPGLLAPLERAGARLFRLLEPLRRGLVGNVSVAGAVATGSVWGLLPCGLVYSSLLFAATAGSAAGAALTMLAFGLGTVPALLAAGLASRALARVARGTALRRFAAAAYLIAAVALTISALRPRSGSEGAPLCHPGAAGAAVNAEVSAAVRSGGS